MERKMRRRLRKERWNGWVIELREDIRRRLVND
jgi:hypothetical protein